MGNLMGLILVGKFYPIRVDNTFHHKFPDIRKIQSMAT